MDRARNQDSSAVSDVIYDMIAAGLSPGPRSYHGLIVSQCLSGDVEGSVRFFLGYLHFNTPSFTLCKKVDVKFVQENQLRKVSEKQTFLSNISYCVWEI